MVKTKNKIFTMILSVILCLTMLFGGIKIANGGREKVSAATSVTINQYFLSNIVDSMGGSLHFKSVTITTNPAKDPSKIDGFNYGPFNVSENGEEPIYAYLKNTHEQCDCDECGEVDLYDCVVYANVDTIYAPVDCSSMFSCTDWGNSCELVYCTDINLDDFNTNNVTNMDWMFCYCKSLTTLDLRNFDFSNVTNMSGMCSYCNSLTTVFASLENFEKIKTIVDAADNDNNTNVVIDVGATTGIEGWKYNKSVPGIYDADTGYLLEAWPKTDEGWNLSTLKYFSGDGKHSAFVSLNSGSDGFEHIFVVCGECPGYINVEYDNTVEFMDFSDDCDIVGVCFTDGVDDFAGVSVKVTSNTIFDCREVSFNLVNISYDKWSDSGAILLPEDIGRLRMEDSHTYVYTNDGISTKELTLPQNYSMQEIEDTTDLKGAVIGKNADEVLRVYNAYVKVDDPVEDTGIDLYSGLAISGAMLILACGCAAILSKMKRKQSM